MRVFAYCCKSFRVSTERAAGLPPQTCPPASARSFDPLWLRGRFLERAPRNDSLWGDEARNDDAPGEVPRQARDPAGLDASDDVEPWELIYFDLHGRPGDDRWYGDDGIVALTAAQIRSVDLGGAVVFAMNCFLGDEESPMLDALLDAGARYVIGAPGLNYGGTVTQVGASLLGRALRLLMAGGAHPLHALTFAKKVVAAQRASGALQRAAGRLLGQANLARAGEGLVRAGDDTLEFRAYYRGNQTSNVKRQA